MSSKKARKSDDPSEVEASVNGVSCHSPAVPDHLRQQEVQDPGPGHKFLEKGKASMIYTAPCIMFSMWADIVRGQVGGGWALKVESSSGQRGSRTACCCRRAPSQAPGA